MRTALASAALILALNSAPAWSQEPEGGDPPTRAARLSFIGGSVSFQPGSVEDWVAATLNRPLTIADRLWTDADGRAEVQIGSAELRLNGRTNFSFLNLDDRTTQIQVSSGTVSVRVRHLEPGEVFEIDTPQLAFSILSAGEFRVDVDEAGNATILTVRGGQAEFSAGGETHAVRPREQVRVTGIDQPVFDSRSAPPADPFDNWCMDRDRREDRSESARYVDRDVPGYADLDLYGTWSEVPEFGAIWIPSRVDIGWAPYRHGHWAWIQPWGWTWVDDAPWGYAPFHYGRWAFYNGSWGWVPGPRGVSVRPVYAPALVAWVGGTHVSVGISVGGAPHVGWFPLAPGEVFVPTYRPSSNYFNRVNVSNTVINRQINVTNVYNTTYLNNSTRVVNNNILYRNQTVNGAVTAVPAAAMASGRRVSESTVNLPQNAVVNAPVQTGAGVAPTRGSVLGGMDRAGARPPLAVMDRQVVARSAAPPPPVPFSRSQSAIEANQGRPLDPQTLRTLQQREPVQNRNIRQVTGDSGTRGTWRQSAPADGSGRDAQPAVIQPRADRPARVDDTNRGFGTRRVNPADIQSAPAPAVIQPRPQERQQERPIERPIDRPIERPNVQQRREERPIERPIDRPMERPSVQQRREERPVERPVFRPAEPAPQVAQPRQDERQIERPAARPAEAPRPTPEARQNREERREQRQEREKEKEKK